MATPTDVLRAIETMDDGQIAVMYDALKARTRALREARARENALLLKPGAPVELCDISPKYLAGCKGEVMEVTTRGIRVSLDESELLAVARNGGAQVFVHKSCVKPA